MKAQILKLGGVKTEAEFYKKYPTEESFMAKHGAKLKKAAFGLEQVASGAGKAAGSFFGNIGNSLNNMDADTVKGLASGVAGGLSGIIGGFDQLKEEKKQLAEANMWGQVSKVSAAAAGSRPQATKRRYVRPEDQMVENMNPLGVAGDNFLQATNGAMIGGNPTEIQNTYAPNVMYTDLGYEPLNDSNKVKNFKKGGKVKKAKSGVAQILGGVGTAASAIPGIGTVASIALPLLGDVYDLIVPDKNAEELKKKQQEIETDMGLAQGQNSVAKTFGQYSESGSVARDGWMSHDWQPQVITKFGDLDVSQVHAFAHDGMPEYRAGGHLKEYTPPSAEAMYTGRAEDGGQYSLGGELKTLWGGKAEPISYNPYLPGTGETVMFKGQSHDETNGNGQSGIGVKYGDGGMTDYAEYGGNEQDADVEVEKNEPGAELINPKTGQKEFNVYGAMVADAAAANHIGDPKAKGRQYKHLIADYAKGEKKANKTIEKAMALANKPDATPIELSTAQVMTDGGEGTLKMIADRKIKAAEWQNAILDIAHSHGLKSDQLAKGKFVQDKEAMKKAMFGSKLEQFGPGGKKGKAPFNPINKKGQAILKDKNKFLPSTMFDINKPDYAAQVAAQDEWMGMGDKYPSGKVKPFNQQPLSRQQSANMVFPGMLPAEAQSSAYLPDLDTQIKNAKAAQAAESTDGGMAWEDIAKTAYASAYPFLRKKVTNPLDYSQLAPEFLAMGMNQEEPVSAQSYSPLLAQPTRYSFQDQLNEITKQTRAAERMSPYNPEAQSIIAANAYDARNKVLGEQSRINQGEQARVAEQNRGTLNEAQRFNIGQFDQQMARASQAKSNTKQQKIEIAKSIAAKIQQNKLETRQANLMQNMYPGFNFTDSGVAYKDPLYLAGLNASGQGTSTKDGALEPGKAFSYNKAGRIIGTHSVGKDDSSNGKNGALVKAIKNL
jgi:hypothetical protein